MDPPPSTHERRSLPRRLMPVVLRQAGLLQAADWLHYLWVRIRNASANRAFLRQHPGFRTPPPHLAYDAHGSVDWHVYLDSGEKVAQKIGRLLVAHLDRLVSAYLEWGCGPGGVIRHIPKMLGENVKVFGTDYNAETIAWCRETFQGITFVHNDIAPPLTFASSTFDCVSGLSVLSHLSEEMCSAWLAELARVTKAEGLVILTTKGDSQEYRLLPAERELLKSGRGVFRGKVREGKRMYDSILPKRYFESILPPSLDVVSYGANAMPEYWQDLWVLKKKPASDLTSTMESESNHSSANSTSG